MNASTPRAPDGDALRRTIAALGLVRARRDSRAVLFAAGVGYLVAYLFTIGDLSFVGGHAGSLEVRVVDDVSRALASRGFSRFGAVAAVSVGPITYLFAPVNVAVAVLLATLVGANLSLTYLAVVQPRACGLGPSTGIVAGLPALLSGAACCGPTILLVVGVQASATIVSGFQLLVPLAVPLLVGSLLLVGGRVDPELS